MYLLSGRFNKSFGSFKAPTETNLPAHQPAKCGVASRAGIIVVRHSYAMTQSAAESETVSDDVFRHVHAMSASHAERRHDYESRFSQATAKFPQD